MTNDSSPQMVELSIRYTIQLFQIVSLSAVAIVGARIAFHQMETARRKLQLDLFDKRFKVYTSVVKFWGLVHSMSDISEEMLQQLIMDTLDAKFLFGEDVENFIQRMRRTVVSRGVTSKSLTLGLVPGQRGHLADELQKYTDELIKQETEIHKIFGRYLCIKEIKERHHGFLFRRILGTS